MTTARQKFELLKAHHEAGHAVIARRLGLVVRRMTVFSTDDKTQAHVWTESAGHKARDGGPAAQIAGLENDVRVGLAGPYAQDRYRPAENRTAPPDEWENDISLALNHVARGRWLSDMARLALASPTP